MKTLNIALLAATLLLQAIAAESLPDDAQALLARRQEAVHRIDEILNEELKKVRAKCLSEEDLEGANSVDALIKEPDKSSVANLIDPIIGTVWNFLGVNGQKINEFKFLGGGKLKCESAYKDAMWKRIDSKTILFGYTSEGSYIILTAEDGGEYMSGRNKGGRARAIRKIR